MAPQAYQTLISLPIYMGTGTVAPRRTGPVSWAQTLMPFYPVEAHFHILHLYYALPRIICPGHALHEKGLQRQKSDGPLASSQTRKSASRPADKPWINR